MRTSALRRLGRAAAATTLAVLGASVALVLLLRWVDPPVSAFMLPDLFAGKGGGVVAHRWVPLERMPEHLLLAVIAAEDQRFAHHHGFDLREIRDAIEERAAGQRVRGASTISQQVAKNLFLWRDRSWVRKGLEAWLTALIELAWPKRRILEMYLNFAQFGPRTYGASAAAERSFRKPVRDLTPQESARLAAVLPNPQAFDAAAPSPRVRARADWVERQMGQLGAFYLNAIL
ncbi:MAG: monofunctional biosynthetic peptidoglycan transglycosylase [Gammaproteobacteria bacterium]|nr:monofunctional biosynthetic peptidoglycan transglycosylase [Gammaproteobacteria bacterium]